MRISTSLHALSAATGIALLGACAGGTAITPRPATIQTCANVALTYTCPATGPIEYISDFFNFSTYVYSGNFAGQAPCGQISEAGVGLYVDPATHDLYAMGRNCDVLVFHRGQTTPYNAYTRKYFYPGQVTITRDGTIVAIGGGALVTWIKGENGGTLVGRFPFKPKSQGFFITSQQNGTIYFDVQNPTTKLGELWKVACPAGHCRPKTQVAGVSLLIPGGLGVSDTGDLLLVNSDWLNKVNNFADTFELPNPNPSSFPLLPGTPLAMAINGTNHHFFVDNYEYNGSAEEYQYLSGVYIGSVQPVPNDYLGGIAVDP